MDEHDDAPVNCEKCGKPVGYVAEDGHKRWVCPKCSLSGNLEAVGFKGQE
jgi:ribosomal protein L37AE/L43A